MRESIRKLETVFHSVGVDFLSPAVSKLREKVLLNDAAICRDHAAPMVDETNTNMKHRWNDTGKNLSDRRKPSLSATLSTTNSTRSNPGLRGKMLATKLNVGYLSGVMSKVNSPLRTNCLLDFVHRPDKI